MTFLPLFFFSSFHFSLFALLAFSFPATESSETFLLPLVEENTKPSHRGDPLEDKESIPSSMTHSLDSESDPVYSPSSHSHSSPGSDSAQGEIPI